MLTIKFTNGEIAQNPSWLSMPLYPIQRMKYQFNDKIIILEDYESYNHLQERVFGIMGTTKNFIRSVYLMGKKGNKIDVIILDMMENIITGYEAVEGTEYGKSKVFDKERKHIGWTDGRPSTGWKNGILAINPRFEIL